MGIRRWVLPRIQIHPCQRCLSRSVKPVSLVALEPEVDLQQVGSKLLEWTGDRAWRARLSKLAKNYHPEAKSSWKLEIPRGSATGKASLGCESRTDPLPAVLEAGFDSPLRAAHDSQISATGFLGELAEDPLRFR